MAAQSRKTDIEGAAAVVDDLLNQLKYAEADKRLDPLLEQARGSRTDVFPLIRLGEKYKDVGKPQQAERILRLVMAELEAAGAEGAEYIREPIYLMGEALTAQKRYDEAEPWYKRYAGIYEDAYKKSGEPPGQVDANLRAALGFLAGFYMTAGRPADAEPIYKRLLAAGEAAVGADDPALQFPIIDLAEAVRNQKRYPEAEALYQ
ncbi:MAG: tetratricopeptide repeat protein, partial [Terriglobales bacterium]